MTWTGQRLRETRARAGISSQQEAAERIGVSVRAYASWERDEAKPQAHWLPKIESAFADTTPTERLDQATIEQALDQASMLDLLGAIARKHARVAKPDDEVADLPPGRYTWRTEDAPSTRRSRQQAAETDQPGETSGGQVL